jgi:hypothetical protein
MALYEFKHRKGRMEPMYFEAPSHKKAESKALLTLQLAHNDFGICRSNVRKHFKLERVGPFFPWSNK